MVASPHIKDEELETYLRRQLDPADATDIKSHVLNCPACEEKLVSGMISQLGQLSGRLRGDHRTEARFRTSESGTMQTLSPLSFDRLDVQILDVSKNGFGLATSAKLQPGTIVLVQVGATAKAGEVSNCHPAGPGKFHIGIRIHGTRNVRR